MTAIWRLKHETLEKICMHDVSTTLVITFICTLIFHYYFTYDSISSLIQAMLKEYSGWKFRISHFWSEPCWLGCRSVLKTCKQQIRSFGSHSTIAFRLLVALGCALSHPGAACFSPSSRTCTTFKSFPSLKWGPLSPTTPCSTPASKISSWSPVALTVARFPCKATEKKSLKNVIMQKLEKSCSEGTKWVTAALQRMEIHPSRPLYGAVKTGTFLCM